MLVHLPRHYLFIVTPAGPSHRAGQRRADGTETTALHHCSLHIHTSQQSSKHQASRQPATVDQYISLDTNRSPEWSDTEKISIKMFDISTSYQFFCACDIIAASLYPFSNGCYWHSIVCHRGHCTLQQMDAWPRTLAWWCNQGRVDIIPAAGCRM